MIYEEFNQSARNYNFPFFQFFIYTEVYRMHTPNLELSNIALKEPHYMAQPTTSNFNFQLEPITHKPKYLNNVEQKILQRQKQLQIRKQLLQNSQKIRRQMLLKKIQAKNERFELRKKNQKENIRSPEAPCLLKAKNKLDSENMRNSQKPKFETGEVHKIYANQPKVPFSSSKGFLRNTGGFESMITTQNHGNQDSAFKQIKLGTVKLPELNSLGQKVCEQQLMNQSMIGQVNEAPRKRKLTKVPVVEAVNPLLKIHDTRYFGIEERTSDFETIGRNLLKQIRNKYWCFDSLENEEVYNNFEDVLLDDIA